VKLARASECLHTNTHQLKKETDMKTTKDNKQPLRHTTPKRARFWYPHSASDGSTAWVRLTLEDGEELMWSHDAPHEEGYHAEQIVFTRVGRVFVIECTQKWRDCDGPGGSYNRMHFTIEKIAGIIAYFDEEEGDKPVDMQGRDIYRPDWTHGQSRRYDAFAEAAGY